MTASVVVPWRGGCEYRERAYNYIRDRHRLPVVEGSAAGGDWIKGAALRNALSATETDIVVVSDADVWTDNLDAAIDAVRAGAPWAIPHRGVFRLSERGTAEYMETGELDGRELDQRPYRGTPGGGIVVAPRETLIEIPIDPRFTGWGQEDESWGRALATLAGHPKRLNGRLVHLWHPPQKRLDRRYGNERGIELAKRYAGAEGDAAAMRSLIKEAYGRF